MGLKDFIKIYNSSLNVEVIASLIKYLNDKQQFSDASVVGTKENPNPVIKKIRNTKSNDFDTTTYSGIHWKNFLFHYILEHYNMYKKSFPLVQIERMSNIDPLLYEEGGFYKMHTDHHGNFPRTLSVIIFLNNDYEGGKLNFHSPLEDNKIFLEVEPKPGRLVMWPSNFLYPHSVSPVTKGKRYTIVSWMI
jgi:predicted 2-oxoglutarate/Fe(II)-dependent dioxygenase YbiX